MCGIAGIVGHSWTRPQLERMIAAQHHRGPDANGLYVSPDGVAGLGHNRLSIIDLSEAGQQPMTDASGRCTMVFNGEVYNYIELRSELSGYPFRSKTDSEVVLAAYATWGEQCLARFLGMFAFAIWDEQEQKLFAARDRFGVKPFYYHSGGEAFLFASEIKALHAAGVAAEPDPCAWATYLVHGYCDHNPKTFWGGIQQLPAGCQLSLQQGNLRITRWYDIASEIGNEFDTRPVSVVEEEYFALLTESIRLRFRSDVPVGINLSGGLDSSLLLELVQQVQGDDSDVKAFTFVTGDPAYDESPWVRQMLSRTKHPSIVCMLTPDEVPSLAASVQRSQDEPFGGMPTLAYAKLFEQARGDGEIVLLDGQGMDEQWAGYDYYVDVGSGTATATVQGITTKITRPECLVPEYAALAETLTYPQPFTDPLRNTQYRDIRFTKIPRALRFNDRISMRSSTELREPFLDHRLVELAVRQPPERKIQNGMCKWMLRRLAGTLLPAGVVEVPKRPLQTPQREWLRGPLRNWATECISTALSTYGSEWVKSEAVRREWNNYIYGASDNSFYVWQWISLGLLHDYLQSKASTGSTC